MLRELGLQRQQFVKEFTSLLPPVWQHPDHKPRGLQGHKFGKNLRTDPHKLACVNIIWFWWTRMPVLVDFNAGSRRCSLGEPKQVLAVD